jgi:hypothetical protein
MVCGAIAVGVSHQSEVPTLVETQGGQIWCAYLALSTRRLVAWGMCVWVIGHRIPLAIGCRQLPWHRWHPRHLWWWINAMVVSGFGGNTQIWWLPWWRVSARCGDNDSGEVSMLSLCRRRLLRCKGVGPFLSNGVANSMVEEVTCVVARWARDHLVWSRRWRVVTTSSIVSGAMAQCTASVVWCHPRHNWLRWKGGMLAPLGKAGQSSRVGGVGPKMCRAKALPHLYQCQQRRHL